MTNIISPKDWLTNQSQVSQWNEFQQYLHGEKGLSPHHAWTYLKTNRFPIPTYSIAVNALKRWYNKLDTNHQRYVNDFLNDHTTYVIGDTNKGYLKKDDFIARITTKGNEGDLEKQLKMR